MAVAKTEAQLYPLLKRSGADALASGLIEYWTARGFAGIQVQILKRRNARGNYEYDIRSNIRGNGYPPRGADAVVVNLSGGAGGVV